MNAKEEISIENAQLTFHIDILKTAIITKDHEGPQTFKWDVEFKDFISGDAQTTRTTEMSIHLEDDFLTIYFNKLTFLSNNKFKTCFILDHTLLNTTEGTDCPPSFAVPAKEIGRAPLTEHDADDTATSKNSDPVRKVTHNEEEVQTVKRKRGRPRLNKNEKLKQQRKDSTNNINGSNRKENVQAVKNFSDEILHSADGNSQLDDKPVKMGETVNSHEDTRVTGSFKGPQETNEHSVKPCRYSLRGVKLNKHLMNAVKGLDQDRFVEANKLEAGNEENTEISDTDVDPDYCDKSDNGDSDHDESSVKRVKNEPFRETIKQAKSELISEDNKIKKRKKKAPGIVACKICKKLLCDYTGVYNHVMRKHSRWKNFEAYIEELNELKKVKCVMCNVEFSDSFKLRHHMEIKHYNREPVKCSKCEKSFKNVMSLKSHERAMHAGQGKCNLCHLCSAAFKTLSNLNQHIKQTHIKKKDFACKFCPQRFCNKPQLKRHSRSHGLDESKRVYCKFCNKSFLFEFNLKRHIVAVHSQRSDKFHCSYCGKGFGHKAGMITHVQGVHFNLFAHSCRECSASFPRSTLLKTHMVSHHGKLDFELPELLSKNGVYDRTTENMFYCSYCSSGFKHKAKLVEHMHTDHANAFPHMCSICNQGFLEKSFLNTHNLRAHDIAQLHDEMNEFEKMKSPVGSGEILQFITTKAGCPSKIVAIQSEQSSNLVAAYEETAFQDPVEQTPESSTLLVEVADGSTTTQYMVEAPKGIVNNNMVVQDISNLLLAAGQSLQTEGVSPGIQEINLVIENPMDETSEFTAEVSDGSAVTGANDIIHTKDINTNESYVLVTQEPDHVNNSRDINVSQGNCVVLNGDTFVVGQNVTDMAAESVTKHESNKADISKSLGNSVLIAAENIIAGEGVTDITVESMNEYAEHDGNSGETNTNTGHCVTFTDGTLVAEGDRGDVRMAAENVSEHANNRENDIEEVCVQTGSDIIVTTNVLEDAVTYILPDNTGTVVQDDMKMETTSE